MAIPDATHVLSVALAHLRAGRLAEAKSLCQQIRIQEPRNPAALHLSGVVASVEGSHSIAVELLRAAAALDPNDPVLLCNLGTAHADQRNFAAAESAFRASLALRPEYPDALYNLGTTLDQLGQADEAAVAYHRALELNPQHAKARSNLGAMLRVQGLLDEAMAELRTGLQFAPSDPVLHINLGGALADAALHNEAIACHRRAVELAPREPAFLSNIAYALHFHPQCDERVMRAEMARWDALHGRPAGAVHPHANSPDPNRRLRIGYVSPDLRDHVVGRNLQPLFAHHDRRKFEIFCYSGAVREDAFTAKFRARSDVWRSVAGLDDSVLAGLIRNDGVDVLVDLSQHMAGNRLPVFARCPAPVQASFAGYPESTGLTVIGHRITDRMLEGEGSGLGAEHLHFLDSFWCYDPCGSHLEPNAPPLLTAGHITFASLNNFTKINLAVLKLWARVLGAVKGSCLMLLSPQGMHRKRVLEVFAAAGVDAERILFTAGLPRDEYLALYHGADIVLDPFPYNGHTTSLDALWMGVPVVTFAGIRSVSRAGLSQLTHLGLPELVAHSDDEYVDIATGLAGDAARLTSLRESLRPRMEASVLMDAPRFTRQIESAYREMWAKWCAERLRGGA